MAHADRMYSTARWRRLRLQILARDGWRCHWCKGPANQVDHIKPLVEGGQPYAPNNLVAACIRCNSSRGATAGNNLRAAGGAGFTGGERFGAIRL